MNLNSINFWVKAFIPNSACTKKGDLFVVTSPPIPLQRFFSGDQREFSDALNASARMHTEVRLEGLSTETPVIKYQNNYCDETMEADADGNIIAKDRAKNDRMFFTNLRGSQSVDPEGGGVVDGIPGSIQIDLVASAGNPLVGFAPDIDYSGTLTIDRAEGNVLFSGDVSNFPAFEIYFRLNDGPTCTLARVQPQVSLDLFGGESYRIDVSTRIAI